MSLTRVTHRPCTLWVVVISVDGKHGERNVQIRVFIVDSWEAMEVTTRTSAARCSRRCLRHSRVPRWLSVVGITQELDLNWAVSKGVLPQQSHDLVQAVS